MSLRFTPPSLPANEEARLRAVRALGVLDTVPEVTFDSLTRLLVSIWSAPIAAMTLVDRDRQWFKSAIGLGTRETPRSHSFCAHIVADPRQPLVVPDAAADPRFAGNPLVLGEPNIRFYAGVPLFDDAGHALGALCVIDRQPREPTAAQMQALTDLAAAAAGALLLRRAASDLHDLATTDGLTGVLNRHGLETRLKTLAPGAVTVAMIDLDAFKAINDRHGHDAGDRLLASVAGRLAAAAPAGALVARLGGDEFAVVAEGEDADGLTRGLQAALCDPPGDPACTATIGAVSGDLGDGIARLLGRADQRMYESKRRR